MRIGDEYRTNPLSHKAGGSIVQITFNNGSVREYDKVKYPESFIEKCFDMDSSIVSAKLIIDDLDPRVFTKATINGLRRNDFGGPNNNIGV
jgi:hypothetical protein